jgi:hypothetical protein
MLGHDDYTPGNTSLRMTEIPNQWYAYRSDLNTRSIMTLAKLFETIRIPILVAPREIAVHAPPNACLKVIPWNSGQPLPKTGPHNPHDTHGELTVYTFNEQTSLVGFRFLGYFIKDPIHTWALDASSVKADRLGLLLKTWFPKAGHP